MINKKYLLITNDDYYPAFGDDDWIGCFETKEQAKEYLLNNIKDYDYYTIVDLEEWVNKEPRKERFA